MPSIESRWRAIFWMFISMFSTLAWADLSNPPIASFIVKPAESTLEVSSTFVFSASAVYGIKTIECTIDDVKVPLPCMFQIAVGPLKPGVHKLKVEVFDQRNVSTSLLYNWTVASSTPPVVIPTPVPTPNPSAPPTPPSSTNGPTVSFSSKPELETQSNAAHFVYPASSVNGIRSMECRLNGVVLQQACFFQIYLFNLVPGSHKYEVTVYDNMGLSTTVSYIWKVLSTVVVNPPPAPVPTPVPNPAPVQPPNPSPSPTPTTSFKYFVSLAAPNTPRDLPSQTGTLGLSGFNASPFVYDQVPAQDAQVPSVEKMVQGLALMKQHSQTYDHVWPFGFTEHILLDWEAHWHQAGQGNVDAGDANLTKTRQNLKKFAESARRMKSALAQTGNSQRKIGFYGIAPIDVWFPYRAYPGSEGQLRDQAAHNLPEMAELVDSVDYLTTTTYLPLNPTELHWTHVEETLKLAKRIGRGKPLYVFVWPQYAGGSGYMGSADWKRQLALARKYGDGLIVWGSYQLPGADPQWNPSSSWWKNFLSFKQGNP